MRKSQLQSIIREEVKAALKETANPELDKAVGNFVKGLATKYGYSNEDAMFAIFDTFKRLGLLNKGVEYRQ